MRKYWAFYRLRFQRTLFYRGSVILFRLSNILMLLTLSALWLASKSNGDIAGYSKNGLVTYYLIGSVINSIVFWNAGPAIKEEIRTGELGAKILTKPVSYYWEKFFEEFSWHTVAPIFALLTTGIAALLLREHISLSIGPATLALLILTTALGSVLFYNISSCFGLLTFWFTETAGIFTMVWAGVFLFGGQAVPLSFFPEGLRGVINILPFRYIYSFPLEIYSGKLDTSQLIIGLLTGVLWIAVTGLFYIWLWRRGIARYSAYGG